MKKCGSSGAPQRDLGRRRRCLSSRTSWLFAAATATATAAAAVAGVHPRSGSVRARERSSGGNDTSAPASPRFTWLRAPFIYNLSLAYNLSRSAKSRVESRAWSQLARLWNLSSDDTAFCAIYRQNRRDECPSRDRDLDLYFFSASLSRLCVYVRARACVCVSCVRCACKVCKYRNLYVVPLNPGVVGTWGVLYTSAKN
jgi:hypothetical protein